VCNRIANFTENTIIMENKVWLITGASKGFGNIWAKAALERGDSVVATARNVDTLTELVEHYGDAILPVTLNVDDRSACFQAVEKAVQKFGRLDVLINNAGFGHFGYIEEISEQDARAQIDTNLFGSLWMIQAVLPIMRSQNSGHILQVSSIGGVTSFPSLGIYHASKWAVEGLCDTLSQEGALFNIKVTLIEPTGYSTDWGSASAKHSEPISAYQPLTDKMTEMRGSHTQADPQHTVGAILKLVDTPTPPLRLFLGKMPLMMIEPVYQKRLAEWKQWQEVAESAE
jgi:NADP-dependent 3-hydroxy acid dehydrogenase YdfG